MRYCSNRLMSGEQKTKAIECKKYVRLLLSTLNERSQNIKERQDHGKINGF